MRIQKTYWIEPEVDARLIGRIQKYGQKKLAKDANVNQPTISRWIHCGIGMREDWYKRIMHVLVGTHCPVEIRRHGAMVDSFHNTPRKIVAGARK